MTLARQTFERIITTNQALGHENYGPLSIHHGFLPSQSPALTLPESHRIWDELMAQMPEFFRTLSLRQNVDKNLPILPADSSNLADTDLLRASSLISILAHSYYRVTPQPPESMPDSIMKPWQTISERLGKHKPFLSYMDLIMYNWRLLDPKQPIIVENLDLLFPTVGNEEERIFYLTQVEIAASCAPIVTAVLRAQEAAFQHNDQALEHELLLILNGLRTVTANPLHKIDPNPHSVNHVNQVVWAKTVAPFAVPITPDTPGPSGTAAPIFHLMDAFFNRPSFDTALGHEAHALSRISPPNWQSYIDAVSQFNIVSYINQHSSASLRGLFAAVVDAYAGDKGFLGTHRLKAYGFLEIAFKVGRSVTIGGFTGLFKDKTWNEIDRELLLTRDERYAELPRAVYHAKAHGGKIVTGQANNWVNYAQIDLQDNGFYYAPGDRIGLLPENSDTLVKLTLDALLARGDEPVKLNRLWRDAMLYRAGFEKVDTLSLADFLRFGKLRPLSRLAAKQLYRLTASELLQRVLNARAEDQWEVWDILNVLYAKGFDTRRLWKSEIWDVDNICKIIPPEDIRQYSIASAPNDDNIVNLVVSGLSYETQQSDVSMSELRHGTASHFLNRLTRAKTSNNDISLSLVTAPRFHLPDDPNCPIVMFAAGSGIAPFLGFLQERSQNTTENWLFVGVPTFDDIQHLAEFSTLAKAERLQLRIAFSREDTRLHFDGTTFVKREGHRCHIDQLMVEEANALWDLLRPRSQGGKGAHVYVCGRSSVARTVEDSLLHIFRQFGANETQFYELVAQRRYHQDVFTTYTGVIQEAAVSYDASELVLHNNPDQGYWMAISGRVYDVTSFAQMHPGGMRIIANNAGIDATRAYQSVLHDVNSEVDSLLGTVEIGVIRRLNFDGIWAVSVGPDGLFYYTLEEAFITWVRYLYLITEMQNALETDFSFMSESTTYNEDPEQITPLKLQLVIESHRRIYEKFISGLLGEDLDTVYRVTLGLCKPNLHILHLRQELDKNQTSGDGVATASMVNLMLTLHQTEQYNDLEQLATAVIIENKHFFEELKQLVRRGVMLFERHEVQVIERSAEALMDTLMNILDVQTRYQKRIATMVRTSGFAIEESADYNPAPSYIGHGTILEQFTSDDGQ